MVETTATEQAKHGAEHLAAHKFKPGQSGNPAGRPKGSRNKLTESFLEDAVAAWQEDGKKALKLMATEKPGDFAKMVAGLVPKQYADEDGEPTSPPSVISLVASTKPLPTADDDTDD